MRPPVESHEAHGEQPELRQGDRAAGVPLLRVDDCLTLRRRKRPHRGLNRGRQGECAGDGYPHHEKRDAAFAIPST